MSFTGHPVFLLLLTGTLVGFNFPLGKLAGEAAIPPALWALLLSAGAALALLPFLMAKRILHMPDFRTFRYAVISALISFVAPNLLLFSVIPHVGSGFAGLLFALSPVFTLTMAACLGQKSTGLLGTTGIFIGLAGASIVSLSRTGAPGAPEAAWVFLALLVPLSLACGNIYRTRAWPPGAQPDNLAFWSHLAACLFFIGFLLADMGRIPLDSLERAPWATLAQMLVAGLTFPAFFRLQQRGGPVLLSQIGYVAAGVSLFFATFLLKESYGLATWFGAAVIALGIGATIMAQITRREGSISGSAIPDRAGNPQS